VPNVIRMLKEEAEQAIKGAGLTPNGVGMKVDRPPSARHKEVYEQDPAAKQLVPKGQTVTFRYYAFIKVPNVVGMRRQQAEQTITRVLLKPDSVQGDKRAPDVLDAGNVYEQSPNEGTLLAEGEPVHIKFYKELGGFHDGDGALVDSRFVEAKVFDGVFPTGPATERPQEERGSAGPRSAIVSSQSSGLHVSTLWWIKRYPSAEDARRHIARQAERFTRIGRPADVTRTGNQIIRTRQLITAGNEFLYATDTRNPDVPYEHSYFERRLLYRGEFVICYVRNENTYDYSFNAENDRVFKKSIELIDLRFPQEGVK
jgi:hypothetical protein